jgi:hypothetical protein
MTTEALNKSGWGWGMFGLYGGFVAFILVIVVFCTFQDIQLVTDNYYEQELVYQTRIDKVNRTGTLVTPLGIAFDKLDQQIELAFPSDLDLGKLAGSVTLFRPSNARYDQTLAVQVDDFGRQYIPTEKLMRGLWKVKIDWNVGGAEYYTEDMVVIE